MRGRPPKNSKNNVSKRRESLPIQPISKGIKKAKNKSRSLSPPNFFQTTPVKVMVSRFKMETLLTTPKSKTPNKKVTPTKAQQKQFEPSVLKKFQKMQKMKIKKCRVRIKRDNLKKLQKAFLKSTKSNNKKRKDDSRNVDSPTSAKKSKSSPPGKSNEKKGKTSFFIKIAPNILKKSNLKTSQPSSKKDTVEWPVASPRKFSVTPTKFSRSELIEKFGKRFFSSVVKVEHCGHPLMVAFEAKAKEQRSKRKLSKNLSVSFQQEVEVFEPLPKGGFKSPMKGGPFPNLINTPLPQRLQKIENGQVVIDTELDQSLFLGTSLIASTPLNKMKPNQKKGGMKKSANNNLPSEIIPLLGVNLLKNTIEDDDEAEFIVPEVEIPDQHKLALPSSSSSAFSVAKIGKASKPKEPSLSPTNKKGKSPKTSPTKKPSLQETKKSSPIKSSPAIKKNENKKKQIPTTPTTNKKDNKIEVSSPSKKKEIKSPSSSKVEEKKKPKTKDEKPKKSSLSLDKKSSQKLDMVVKSASKKKNESLEVNVAEKSPQKKKKKTSLDLSDVSKNESLNNGDEKSLEKNNVDDAEIEKVQNDQMETEKETNAPKENGDKDPHVEKEEETNKVLENSSNNEDPKNGDGKEKSLDKSSEEKNLEGTIITDKNLELKDSEDKDSPMKDNENKSSEEKSLEKSNVVEPEDKNIELDKNNQKDADDDNQNRKSLEIETKENDHPEKEVVSEINHSKENNQEEQNLAETGAEVTEAEQTPASDTPVEDTATEAEDAAGNNATEDIAAEETLAKDTPSEETLPKKNDSNKTDSEVHNLEEDDDHSEKESAQADSTTTEINKNKETINDDSMKSIINSTCEKSSPEKPGKKTKGQKHGLSTAIDLCDLSTSSNDSFSSAIEELSSSDETSPKRKRRETVTISEDSCDSNKASYQSPQKIAKSNPVEIIDLDESEDLDRLKETPTIISNQSLANNRIGSNMPSLVLDDSVDSQEENATGDTASSTVNKENDDHNNDKFDDLHANLVEV